MIDNLEMQALLAHKIAFKCSIVCKSNEILDLWPTGTQKSKKMSNILKAFCPIAFFMHHPLDLMRNANTKQC